tara:strand:+ start:150 stop:509 length:360 start_codon:yes stop_codon:yes gene_type:complete
MKNKKIKTICFDLDGVICLTKKNNYKLSKPVKKNINFINKLYKKYKIIIFTSRFMGRNNDVQKKAIKQGYKFTSNQLKKWKLNYTKLILGKPSYDIYIDDKNLEFKYNWRTNLEKKLKI